LKSIKRNSTNHAIERTARKIKIYFHGKLKITIRFSMTLRKISMEEMKKISEAKIKTCGTHTLRKDRNRGLIFPNSINFSLVILGRCSRRLCHPLLLHALPPLLSLLSKVFQERKKKG
jgi:hypothetical protein